ncbi:MAG: hypothetical protein KC416_01275 [Myxococcales bacterium]|nr:hypothetical protein [Myxococcales bacterium]
MSSSGNGVVFIGMGAAFPSQVRTNDWWSSEHVETHLSGMEDDIVGSTDHALRASPTLVDKEVAKIAALHPEDPFRGAKERRILEEPQTASDLETEAAKIALANAGLRSNEIDLLILFAQVPDYPCPGNHALVAAKLGCPPSTASMTVGIDCASFVANVKVASALLKAGEHRNALIIQSSLASRVVDWERPASVNVGDGSVAFVLTQTDSTAGYIGSTIQTLGDFHAAVRIAPNGNAATPWYAGSTHRQNLVFQTMDKDGARESGSRAPSFCRETCLPLLERHGYSTADVDAFVCSQPTSWFGSACCEALDINQSRLVGTFERFAHLMPASVGVNLVDAHETGKLAEGDLVLVYTPGAGLIQAALLWRWSLPKRPAHQR